MPRKPKEKICPVCKTDEHLFGGWFDADDYAYPLAQGEPTPPGVRWTDFCNQCGTEAK